jgi:hypothetical protein
MLAPPNVKVDRDNALTLKAYSQNLWRRDFSLNALRIALIAGSLVITVNHGEAFLKGKMTPHRWLSVAVSFIAPYAASIYGQSVCQLKSDRTRS